MSIGRICVVAGASAQTLVEALVQTHTSTIIVLHGQQAMLGIPLLAVAKTEAGTKIFMMDQPRELRTMI
jgi:hypothetical protein